MRTLLSCIGVLALVGLAGCTAAPKGGNVTGGGGAQATGGSGGGGGVGKGGDGGDLFGTGGIGVGGGTSNDCVAGQDEDHDADGVSIAQGDCNDCDVNVNPGAVEVMTNTGGGGSGGGGPGVPTDEDCDGLIDEMDPDLMPCDSGLALDGSAADGAKAIDLCKVASGPSEWGVLESKWVLADGSPSPGNPNFDLGHGILPSFGPNTNVQKGQRMLAVSSGTARQPLDAGYQPVSGFSKGYSCTHPAGFPKESPSCGVAVTGACYDSTGLELKIRVPTNAHGFSFNFNFYTYEWPGYVCSTFNDFFTAILSPIPAGQSDGNITFDNLGNPVSVNNAFVEACGCPSGPPCLAGGKTFTCALGDLTLMGTGFGADEGFGQDHGSTSWLLTQAPIEPGTEMSIRFTAYDSGDGVLDSTGLIDNFNWIAEPGTQIGTKPIPDPK